MRILHLNTFDSGGAAKAAINLHNALLDDGIDSSILFLKSNKTKNIRNSYSYLSDTASLIGEIELNNFKILEEEKLKQGISGRIDCEILTFPNTSFSNLHSHRLVRECDIIHLHWVARFIDMPTFFSCLDKPIVWTFHDENPYLGIFHYQRDVDNNLNLKIIEKWALSIKKASLNSASLNIITPSNWLRQRFLKNSNIRYNSVSVIENITPVFNSVRNQLALRRKYGLSESSKIILFVASDLSVKRKRFDLFKKLATSLSSPSVKFVVVGKSNGVDIPSEIFLFEDVDSSEMMKDIYSLSDLSIICSLEDNLPNVMMESLSAGTPVLAFESGGMSEVINSGNGRLVKGKNDELFKNELEGLLRLVKWPFNKQAIQSFFNTKYEPKNIIDKVKIIYDSLADVN